ncbi:MAG TPA: energy transducer TonB [Tenuifilaceae bacterium]|nr:energy transducer TonB [Tenuifilaceae bacterium]
MVPKKTSKADLEGKKSLFFEIGLALSMLLVLLAFEWKSTRNIDLKDFKEPIFIGVIEEMPTSKPDEIKTPPPPKPIKYSDYIKVVPDNVKIKTDEDPFINNDPSGPIPDFIPLPVDPEVDEPVFVVEEMPKFGKGGLDEFRMEFVMKRLRYPEEAQANGVSGCVYLEFVVEKDGSLSGFKPLRNIDVSLVNEAIRVVKMSPKWTPGKHNGKPARVKFVLPVNLVLN